ncbi:60S acidic ribosomal protein P0-like [Neltuma alba]|uniref:60S acidic ribosomal protein P0-like n=1 Tax=Neltuma alba TaxID=207710 RepID=UPI0010A58761|nr:60S acidic ribosomal protein P0-like [Prosopis alba]
MTASAIAVKPWKAAYEAKLWKLLKEYGQILVISTDNAESNQLQKIRRDLHEDSVMVLGKNTLKRRTIKMDADSSGNKAFLNLLPLLVGNVALIFTKADLKELSEVVAKYEVVHPHLMCPKFMSYDSYRNCLFVRSRQLPLSLRCCRQLFPETTNPLLLSPRFLPQNNCFLTRSRQFLIMSIWAPLLHFAGTL